MKTLDKTDVSQFSPAGADDRASIRQGDDRATIQPSDRGAIESAGAVIERYGRDLQTETDPDEIAKTVMVIETALLVIKSRIGGGRGPARGN